MPLKHDLLEFPGLSRQAFQHPLDVQAAAVLRGVPGLPTLIRFMSETFYERIMTYTNLSSHLRVSERQYASLHRQFVRMARVLDVAKLPSLFVSTTPWTVNAYAMGIENYSVVICSGLLDILEEDELLAILGHELGHVKCEHQLFNTLASWLALGGGMLLGQAKIPGVDMVLSAGRVGLEYALMDWSRKAELSCDRAALLATQDPDAVGRAMAKLGGFSRKYSDELNLDEAEAQGASFDDLITDSFLMKLMRLEAMRSQTHPYPMVRVKEVRGWSRSSEYKDILAGQYRKNRPSHAAGNWREIRVETPRARECPKCKCPSAEDQPFCPACQSSLSLAGLICSQCRQHVDPDWAACMDCGSWLSENPPEKQLKLPG